MRVQLHKEELDAKLRSLGLTQSDLRDIERKLDKEGEKLKRLGSALDKEDTAVQRQLDARLQTKQVELQEQAEGVKREEVSLFDRENREYELEQRQREVRNALERKRVLMNEKELELKRLREEAFRREARIQCEANRLLQQEETLDEEAETL